jgi:hypothetical protein
MALQSTGKISLSDIQTMFGGTNPIGMSEYYNNNASGFTTGVTGIPNSGATISISHFYGKAKPSSGGLYTFSSHTFTNAGATGRTGPIISQVRSAYSGATWAQNNSFLSMTTQGIQEWTVPATGIYTITCAGAGGNKGSGTAGRGYVIVTNQTLNKGQVLKILVGQVGTSAYGRGGGGGTFVATSLNIPLVVCGGGGGVNMSDNQVGKDATGIGGADVAGSDGAGTQGCGMHGAGGASFTNNSTYALSFVNGGTGGSMPAGGCVTISYGGFGGGGGGGNGGGGGGGYSGGNGGENNPPYYGGNGGGSYCSTTVNSTSYNPHNTAGYVTITSDSIIQAPSAPSAPSAPTGDISTYNAITATSAVAFSYIAMPGGSRTLLNYLQSFGVLGTYSNTGSGTWLSSHSGNISYTANPISNNTYFTTYGRVRIIDGDGSSDGPDWAVFNFGLASNGDFDGCSSTYAYFGGENSYSGGTGGLAVTTGYVWGFTTNGWTMLYRLSLPGDGTNNHTNGNWFTSGGTVTTGNGKRSEYDSSPITHLGFSVS